MICVMPRSHSGPMHEGTRGGRPHIAAHTPSALPAPTRRLGVVRSCVPVAAHIAIVAMDGVVGWSVVWDDDQAVSGVAGGPLEMALPAVVAAVEPRAGAHSTIVFTPHAEVGAALQHLPGVVAGGASRGHPLHGDACRRARDEASTALRSAPPLLVAVDGSFGRRRTAGWAFLAEDGQHRIASERHVVSSMCAEVGAIRLALASMSPHRRLVIRSDSSAAIDQVTGSNPVSGALAGSVPDVRRMLKGRDVEFQWVRGHIGPGLHDGADRLAYAARRMLESRVSADAARGMAAGIVAESLAAHHASTEVT